MTDCISIRVREMEGGPAAIPLSDDARQVVERQYDMHGKAVFHLCLRLGAGNVAWAKDATQDVFLRLMGHVDGLEDRDDLGGWLRRVAYRRCLDRLKRENGVWGRVKGVLSNSADAESPRPPDQIVNVRQELRAVLGTLESLQPSERLVFTMYHLDQMSQPEIGEVLGFSKGYVSKLLKRATTRIRRQGWRDDA